MPNCSLRLTPLFGAYASDLLRANVLVFPVSNCLLSSVSRVA